MDTLQKYLIRELAKAVIERNKIVNENIVLKGYPAIHFNTLCHRIEYLDKLLTETKTKGVGHAISQKN